MAGKRAAAFYFRGRERLYTDTIDAERDLHEALRLHLFVYKINIDEGHHWSSSSFEYAKNTAYNLFNVPFQTPTPWDIFETMIAFCKLESTYADSLETPITETLCRSRPDLAHKYRNKAKPLEQAVVQDAKWTDAAMRGRLVESIKKTEASLLAKTKLAR